MTEMKSLRTLVSISWSLLVATACGVPLEFDLASAHDLKVRALGEGGYEITTTGSDPFLYTRRLGRPLQNERISIVSFETFALQPIKNVQIFFGPPIIQKNSVSGGWINSSEGWVPFSMDLATSPNWKKGASRFRIDFGRKAGIKLQLRALTLRSKSEAELKRERLAEEKNAAEKELGQAIRDYFSKEFESRILEVSVDKETVRITLKADRPLLLAEVRTWQHVQLIRSKAELEWSQEVKTGESEVSLPRLLLTGKDPYDRLHSRWCLFEVVGSKVQLASHARCPSDTDGAKIKSIPVPEPATKKGIGVSWRPGSMGMLEELGVKHATHNIELTSLLRVPEGTPFLEHRYLGRTFRINKNIVDHHTRSLSWMARRGYLVSAILLIAPRPPAALRSVLLHPDYQPEGIYSMANVTSPEGVFHYAMLVDFLASYFTTEERGFLHQWIVHNEVDAAWVWTNCGRRGPDTMMEFYVKSMRIVDGIARQYNPKARALISLTHYWKMRNKHGPAETMYAPRHLLEILSTHSKREGDFGWGVAYHPYPVNLRNPRVWEDKVSWSFDADIISYKNLEVLPAYLRQERFLYQGKLREIHLTEQGISNPDDSPEQLQIQAAGVAYAMKKVNGVAGIRSHIMHRWVDHGKEGGLNLGLVKKKPGTIATAGEKKPSFQVYASIGTEKEEESCRFALEIIGIKSWDEIFYRGTIR
jgi:hypothetical protein